VTREPHGGAARRGWQPAEIPERNIVDAVQMPYAEAMSTPMRTIVLLATALAGVLCGVTGDGSAVAGASCHDGGSPAVASKGTAATFERLYKAWHREAEAIRFSSNTHDYVALPSYRRIVGLGRAALPFLERKLSQDRDADFMLADAVVEICGWDRRALANDSAQVFRDNVLRRLRGSE
jgi:hypothetical protein